MCVRFFFSIGVNVTNPQSLSAFVSIVSDYGGNCSITLMFFRCSVYCVIKTALCFLRLAEACACCPEETAFTHLFYFFYARLIHRGNYLNVDRMDVTAYGSFASYSI